MTKNLQGISLEISIHWPYLHKHVGKNLLEISKMKFYGKYSGAAIFRHMIKNIGDLVPGKQKQTQGMSKNVRTGKRRKLYFKLKYFMKKWGTLVCSHASRYFSGQGRFCGIRTLL